MRFVVTTRGLNIAKSSKVPKGPAYRRLEALNRQMSRSVQVNLLRGIKTFKKRIDPDEMMNAWRTGDYEAVTRIIPWDSMSEDVDLSGLDDAIFGAARQVIPTLPPPVERRLRFDIENPNITNYVGERTGSLIRDLKEGSQEILQEAISQSFSQALPPSAVAARIRGSIGLYPRLDRAVERYRDGLLASGAPPVRALQLTEGYRDRLLDYRAMTIARTETRRATDNGQLAVWKQSVEQGALGRATTRKVWQIDGDPCPICIPMDGVAVNLYDQWIVPTPQGPVSCDVPADSHPNCLCTMTLEFDDVISDDQPQENEDDEQEDQA